MSELHEVATTTWRLLGTGLLHGTVLAAITLLLTSTLLRRARPALLVALWTIVLAKFALPIGPELPFSVDTITSQVVATPVDLNTPLSSTPAVTPQVIAPNSYAALWASAKIGLIGLYLAVFSLLLARRLRAHRHLYRRATNLPHAHPAIANMVAKVASTLAVAIPETRESEAGPPHVVGATRPILVIPSWLATEPHRLEAVVLHELAHLRRRDTWLRVAQLVIGTAFFFWPVVALVNRRIDCTREIACDDWAVVHSKLGSAGYARLLFAVARRDHDLAPTALAMSSRRGQLEVRIASLLAHRPRHVVPHLNLLTTMAVALWALLALGRPARAGAPPPPSRLQCLLELEVVAPNLADRILTQYPEADRDGDGELTRYEICAHQELIKRRIVDEAFASMAPDMARDIASWLDPEVDRDGDGVLSDAELVTLKSAVATNLSAAQLELDPIEFPGQVCEETPVPCE